MIRYERERGQILVIAVFGLLALVVFSALIIDGGTIYVNRRIAQTAADASAMAAAREECINRGTYAEIQAVAEQYAVARRGSAEMNGLKRSGASVRIAAA